MPLSAPSKRDTDGRCSRDRATADPDAAERLRSVRERLEAAVSGLGELEYLRQRQEELVRAALELRETPDEEEEERSEALSSEEKLLEENILLLRKQLTCLRRRDAGLMSQLQELDRQISDLRLDTEESHDHLEMDSRPSSGFYELSDGASGSLSNSSNSVFSECFCSTVDAEGRLPPTDDSSCLECDGLVGGLHDDPSSGPVRRSFSAPHPPALDPVPLAVSMDSLSKYHCDLVARKGSDVYRYPSPLHAVAVQSPSFLQMLSHGSHSRDEVVLKVSAEPDSPLVPQSSSWPVTSSSSSSSSSSQTPCHKRLDSYIFSLLQRRVLPIRTSRPRTSISTDPSKSILRQASLCVRQVSGLSSGPGSGFGTLWGSELKPPQAAGGGSMDGASSLSPQRQRSVESKGEVHEPQNGCHIGGDDTMVNSDLAPNQKCSLLGASIQNNTDVKTGSLNKKRLLPSAASTSTLPKDFRELGSPKAHPTPKQSKQVVTVRSSSPSQDEAGGDAAAEGGGGHMVSAKSAPTQKAKLHKSNNKNIKAVKVKTSRASEHLEPTERGGEKSHHRSSSKKSRPLQGGGSTHIKASKRSPAPVATSSRVNKHLPVFIPEGRVLDKHATSTLSSNRSGVPKHYHHGNHHHHSNHHHHHHHHHHLHGRDQVVVIAKPKHKRNDYRRLHRLRAIMEVPHDEAFRRTHQRQRKELLSHSVAGTNLPSTEQLISPYCYVGGSDSEYSAECASLFHSTIMDTSEDERSNYTTNCFGDSESSEDEYVEESTTTSDTEESGGGGQMGGRRRSDIGALAARGAGQEMTPAQAKAFVKIKASHNLKKKILRFRSGSLKLMTTV